MRKPLLVVLLGVVIAAASFAQPSVSALQNNYSYILPGLPNYGIAQGSIFVIYGKNMGPAQITSVPGFPLTAALGGVTMNVTGSDGKTYQALPYYVSAGQSAAILPSATPAGNATITVTFNGQTSATAQVKVVKTAFGILTLNGSGSGPAAAFDTRGNYLGVSNAANPGEVVTLWGTGVGPAPGNETTVGGTASDLGSAVPITVWVGGQQATVQYHGRSQYPGLDQVNVFVPSGITGCNVSVVVQGGSIVSNVVTIPIAQSGRVCSDANALSSADLQALLAKGTISLGSVSVGKSTSTSPAITVGPVTIPGSTTTSDNASAIFYQYTAAQYSTLTAQGSQVSIGGCSLFTYTSGSATSPSFTAKYLDAGPSISLSPPSGSPAQLAKTTAGGAITYGVTSCSVAGQTNCVQSLIPASGGKFTFDNGSGGADVGHFSTSVTLAPNLVWTNMDQIGPTVSASAPPTVTWTGGDPNGYIAINGSSQQQTSTTQFLGASFTCTAPQSALKFTIPQWVLLALPPSGSTGATAGFPLGSMGVYSYGQQQAFTAPGIDVGYAIWYMSVGKSLNYSN